MYMHIKFQCNILPLHNLPLTLICILLFLFYFYVYTLVETLPFLCPQLQVHSTQHAATNPLYAELSGRAPLHRSPYRLPARLRLRQAAGRTPAQCLRVATEGLPAGRLQLAVHPLPRPVGHVARATERGGVTQAPPLSADTDGRGHPLAPAVAQVLPPASALRAYAAGAL